MKAKAKQVKARICSYILRGARCTQKHGHLRENPPRPHAIKGSDLKGRRGKLAEHCYMKVRYLGGPLLEICDELKGHKPPHKFRTVGEVVPFGTRREKLLELTKDDWNFLAESARILAGTEFLHHPLSKMIGRNGERAYRLGTLPHPGGK